MGNEAWKFDEHGFQNDQALTQHRSGAFRSRSSCHKNQWLNLQDADQPLVLFSLGRTLGKNTSRIQKRSFNREAEAKQTEKFKLNINRDEAQLNSSSSL